MLENLWAVPGHKDVLALFQYTFAKIPLERGSLVVVVKQKISPAALSGPDRS